MWLFWLDQWNSSTGIDRPVPAAKPSANVVANSGV